MYTYSPGVFNDNYYYYYYYCHYIIIIERILFLFIDDQYNKGTHKIQLNLDSSSSEKIRPRQLKHQMSIHRVMVMGLGPQVT